MNATTADARSATFTAQPGTGQMRRSGDDRMLAGVAGGIARCLNAGVTLVRVIIAAPALFTGAGAALYLAAWRNRRSKYRNSAVPREPAPVLPSGHWREAWMRRRSSQARAQAATSEAVIPRVITAGPTITSGRPYAKP